MYRQHGDLKQGGIAVATSNGSGEEYGPNALCDAVLRGHILSAGTRRLEHLYRQFVSIRARGARPGNLPSTQSNAFIGFVPSGAAASIRDLLCVTVYFGITAVPIQAQLVYIGLSNNTIETA